MAITTMTMNSCTNSPSNNSYTDNRPYPWDCSNYGHSKVVCNNFRWCDVEVVRVFDGQTIQLSFFEDFSNEVVVQSGYPPIFIMREKSLITFSNKNLVTN